MIDGLHHNLGKVDRRLRRIIFFSLDTRQRHQVTDQRLHPVRFLGHDAQKAPAGVGVVPGSRVIKRFNKTFDGGKGGEQFMAGIGNEIDTHFFRRLGTAAIGQVDHFLIRPDGLDAHIPHLALLTDAGEANRMSRVLGVGIGEAFDRAGMAEGDADILAHDIDAQKLARKLVCRRDPGIFDNQDRIVGGIDKGL